eukprot:CAMPEP_0182858688 /NCGR_PEP_ID=MMETSP0034_2-20130328/3818_1 /TAXON_ID=156128 /ORGANISM="Nephroselmis pyriformis, Strain CCMP717" /LENGTH=58 /DNA_ID=CAMNT_0024990141 /DNA_START=756 /DNA_END=932 /DNA_ORIENTATION=+
MGLVIPVGDDRHREGGYVGDAGAHCPGDSAAEVRGLVLGVDLRCGKVDMSRAGPAAAR